MSAHRAFTLIELLIVVAIIAILAAIAVPNFLEAQVRAKVSRVKSDMRSVVTALESYRIDQNEYPQGTDNAALMAPEYAAYLGTLAPGFYALRTNHPTLLAGRDYATLTTPISYISSMPLDPFAESILTYAYRNAQVTKDGWVMTSLGPDTDLRSEIGGKPGAGSANASNPLSTAADTNAVARIGDLNERAVVHQIEGTAPFAGANQLPETLFRAYLADLSYDPTNGTTSEGDIIRVGPERFVHP